MFRELAPKLVKRVFALGLSGLILLLPILVKADTNDNNTRLTSPHYSIESMFFGNTGVVYSVTATIPPHLTVLPYITNLTASSATINWETDKATNGYVHLGTEAGVYTNQFGSADLTLKEQHAVTLNMLSKGVTYYFKVRSADVDGNTIESGSSSFMTDLGDITPPIITMGPSLSVDSSSLVTISWETNELASSSVEYGIKEVSENTLGRADELTLFHQVKVPGLQAAQAYLWRVKSRDASGNMVYSATARISTPISPYISGFSITDVTLTSAVVQWNTSTSSTQILEYGTASSKYDQRIADESISTSHVVKITGLSTGTTYYLKVSGVDQAGNLLQSDEKIFATVVIPQITDLQVSNVTADSATVTWKSSSAIDELLRYEILNSPNTEFIGKKFSGGTDTPATEHTYQIQDLESAAEYSLVTMGKDVFGNQAISNTVKFTTQPDHTPPVLLNVRSDTTVDLGAHQSVQVIVSAECNELCKIIINYGPGSSGPYDKKVETDKNYTHAKLSVIPGLVSGQSYHFQIQAFDRTGNVATTPDYLVLAPAQPVSLLDLIFGQIRSNFGWLQNL